MNETELAARLVRWLEALDWEVYQEVSVGGGCPRADIVAVQKPLIWVIETKMSLTAQLCSQACRWIGDANRVSVAIPQLRGNNGSYFLKQCLRNEGVGILTVRDFDSEYSSSVDEMVAPRLMRRRTDIVIRSLREEQRIFAAAGNADGKFYSPWRHTCAELCRIARTKPGVTMKDAIDEVKHHYASPASARSAMAKWIRLGKIPGIEGRIEGGKLRLYPVTPRAATPSQSEQTHSNSSGEPGSPHGHS